ncbi:MAG: right-handed parallel beta-helix repeat-containing protein, partial [Candidatus Marinimicrobia bacterium]|nr:right-handed parallel beta-helix repeat-containing protein [Candidatus Neomarinimicrobiota bacterium]
NKPLDLSGSSELLRLTMLFVWVSVLASCGGNIRIVDTDVDPAITDDNKLKVTLQGGREVELDIRGEEQVATLKTECDASVYEEIGSFTYVEKILEVETFPSNAAENARRAELRTLIIEKREGLEQAFKDDFPTPASKRITCNLVLQADDLIFMRMRFVGPASSNVTVDCLGEGDERAQIRNPVDTSVHKDKNKDPIMLEFSPSNCGIEPLEQGGSRYIDELGAVKSSCDPVSNVKISNCRIRGRVWARSFKDDLFNLSNVRADHVKRLRESAAQHVTFSNVQILGRYKGAVHFLPGVHHFTIEDSEILGGFLGITIHLPADGGWNVIKNNTITGQRKTGGWPGDHVGGKREVISIDSSEHNRIVNNHISDMPYGGIYLYRNCGERGSIRHRIPQYNQIINNVFDYSVGAQNKPTIFVGSRDDKSIKYSFGVGVKRYCHDDEGNNGERFTGNDSPRAWDTETVRNSSESNSDWAQNNVIADNQLIQFNSTEIFNPFIGIKLSSKAKKLDNYLIGNEAVSGRSTEDALNIQARRGAGCAVLAGITNEMQSPYFMGEVKNGHVPYIRNNQSAKYFWDIRPVVQLACGTPLVCQNNILRQNQSITCDAPIIHDYGSEAQACDADNNVCAESNNAGDSHTLGCPGGRLIGIQAACNLEFGKASDSERRRVLLNRVKVVRKSDHKDDGRCRADGTNIKDGQRLILPWLLNHYDGETVANEISYECKEHDKNGGDCHVNIRHYCEPFDPVGPEP